MCFTAVKEDIRVGQERRRNDTDLQPERAMEGWSGGGGGGGGEEPSIRPLTTGASPREGEERKTGGPGEGKSSGGGRRGRERRI